LTKEIEQKYDLGKVIEIKEINRGWNVTYKIITQKGKYFVKPFKNVKDNSRPYDEVAACKILSEKGIPVSTFVSNKENEYITIVNDDLKFHVQEFVEGDVWEKNSAPLWLIKAGVGAMLDIHLGLKEQTYEWRNAFANMNDFTHYINKIDNLASEMKKRDGDWGIYLDDLERRKSFLLTLKKIDLDKLTLVNGHSDYTVTQLITNGEEIAAIIDMTEVSKIPAIWEIMRFYLNSSILIEDELNLEVLDIILADYVKRNPLNHYDLEQLFDLNYLYMIEALSVYDKLLLYDTEKFQSRAKKRIRLLDRMYSVKERMEELGGKYAK